jgi:uncharacterized protein
VNPFFFGTSQRRLFGIHSPAASRAGKSRAAVLCQPWGDEYIYAHRPLRQLAVRLSLAGFHTLRFDYFGTGDSAGEAFDTNVTGMQSDVLTAIETLKDLAAAEKVSLIGLRAGANVAAGAAASSPAEIEALVLWDPILTGDSCGDSVPDELQPLDLDALPGRSLVLITQSPPAHNRASRIELLPAPPPWTESVSTSGVIPLPVIQRIEEWLR